MSCYGRATVRKLLRQQQRIIPTHELRLIILVFLEIKKLIYERQANTCLIGSGIRYIQQRATISTAFSKLILCPMET